MTRSATRGCAAAYKALPGGTYGCEREEAGGLALLSKALFAEAVSSEAVLSQVLMSQALICSAVVSGAQFSEALVSEAALSEAPTDSPLPRAILASSLSREGHIISMRMLLSQATQRRKR